MVVCRSGLLFAFIRCHHRCTVAGRPRYFLVLLFSLPSFLPSIPTVASCRLLRSTEYTVYCTCPCGGGRRDDVGEGGYTRRMKEKQSKERVSSVFFLPARALGFLAYVLGRTVQTGTDRLVPWFPGSGCSSIRSLTTRHDTYCTRTRNFPSSPDPNKAPNPRRDESGWRRRRRRRW